MVDNKLKLLYNQDNGSVMTNKSRTIIAQTEGLTRTETFLGETYTVVPVVAMVEGVRFGMAQDNPELGLATEFGKFPAGWNNRPVVMNHPTVNGQLVSANSPSVLTDFAFGFTCNTKVEDGKLKMEAWINPTRCETLGEETQRVLERVAADEIIEVSVGFFSEVEETKGSFKGQAYGGIWRNIVPDHLAFLSEGVKGACSVEAGCGTPRVNQSQENAMPLKTAGTEPVQAPKTQCAGASGECTCKGKGTGATVQSTPPDHTRTLVQKLFGQMFDGDIYKLVSEAIGDKYGWCYVIGIDSSAGTVVYEKYNSDDGQFETYQTTFTLNGVEVTLTSDPVEVAVIATVVPKGDSMTTQNAPTSATTEASAAATGNEPAATVETTETKTPAVQSAPLTVQQYIEQAPPEMRDMLESGMKLHAAKKANLIKALKETGRCKFDDSALSAMNVDTLQNLVDLAAPPADFSGRKAPETQAPVAQASNEQFVPAPKVFELKKTA